MSHDDTALIPASRDPSDLALRRDALNEEVRAHVEESTSAATRRAYRSDWRDFETWCRGHGEAALPATPDTVARYVTDLGHELKASTLQRRLASISVAHRLAGHESPTHAELVHKTMRGIRRSKAQAGEAPDQKEAAVTAIVKRLVASFPDDTTAHLRNRALILLGFAGAFRRSELVALDASDLRFTNEGLIVRVRLSKTDQEGTGDEKGIPYGSRIQTCPVRTLRAWLDTAGISTGAIFRAVDRNGHVRKGRLSDHSVAAIIKEAAKRADLDPAAYAGHSLRAGLATAAAQAGVSERVIMAQTGHKSVQVARRYIRRGDLFRENAAAEVGL